MQLFLSFVCLKQVSNRCTSGSSATTKISSPEGVWSYDSWLHYFGHFQVDSMIFDRFNTDFTGVEACIGLSYKAWSFSFEFWFLVFSLQKECFVFKKNVLVLIRSIIGSLQDSTVFSTICFSGLIISWNVSPMQRPPPFYQSSKCDIFCESNRSFSQSH